MKAGSPDSGDQLVSRSTLRLFHLENEYIIPHWFFSNNSTEENRGFMALRWGKRDGVRYFFRMGPVVEFRGCHENVGQSRQGVADARAAGERNSEPS